MDGTGQTSRLSIRDRSSLRRGQTEQIIGWVHNRLTRRKKMLKKILVGVFLIIMLGAVVAGTVSLFANADEACAASQERGQGTFAHQGADPQVARQARGRAGRELDTTRKTLLEDSQGNGYGRRQGVERDQSLGGQALAEEPTLETIDGVVIETTELVIKTGEGETIQVGLGPSHYREEQGFTLSLGAQVRISGYWENDEFKAAQITNLDSGDTIVLRDASGRPMWSGQGRGLGRG
jgi:hypothetical protein